MNLRPALVSILAIASSTGWAAVRGNEVMYVGGTMTAVPEKTEGTFDVSSDKTAEFKSKKNNFSIPFAKVTSLEYGQKAGRRVGAALAVSPVLLLSKKRKHFLTIAFEDAAGAKQGVVFEIGKDHVRSIATTLETKSGKKLEYESEDAKKNLPEGK
jgi:hypothetical protein